MTDTLVTPWTVADQAPVSMEFPRQEYCRGVSVSFSIQSSQPRYRTLVCISRRIFLLFLSLPLSPYYYACLHALWLQSCLSETTWTVPHQAPLSVGFCRQEYWSGLPRPAAGDLSHSGIKPDSSEAPAFAGTFGLPWCLRQ